jgi:hypothetical protein
MQGKRKKESEWKKIESQTPTDKQNIWERARESVFERERERDREIR